MGYTPHVLVIGGGAIGTGVARDLAMRGLEVTMVEAGTLTAGSTGRIQGLLHSGARFTNADPGTARRCIEENRVLREVAGHCVEDAGGLFVRLPGNDPDYLDAKREACEDCGIPVERLSGERAREREPALSPDVEAALAVPDAAVDPFRLTVANARAAMNHGAAVETHTRVLEVERTDEAVDGVRVRHELPTERGPTPSPVEVIEADYVVNATGPWAGEVAGTAGLDVDLAHSRGVMVIQDYADLDTVVNRCRPETDGNVVVPQGENAILGTTEEPADGPEDYPEESRDVEFLLDELAEVVPGLADARTFRSYWGVWPLYEPAVDSGADPGETSRDFAVLDHEARDGVWGISTVVGGRFTTYRRVAEAVADHVCGKFGIDRSCRTDQVPLPGHADEEVLEAAMADVGLSSPVASRSADRLGSRATEVLDTGGGPNPVVCECEAVTRAEVRDAIDDETGETVDLNEVRIRTRASMGTCQGGRCVHRIAAELHPDQGQRTVRRAANDLFEERWKGQRPVLWGDQLAQAARNYTLQATTMNRDGALQEGVQSIEYARFDPGKEWVEDMEDLP